MKFQIAVDCDEVLVNIQGKWAQKILNTISDEQEVFDTRHPVNRPNYEITSFLPDPSLISRNKAYDLYFKDPSFYQDLEPTPYCRGLLSLIENGLVEKLAVITHCGNKLTYPCTRSKFLFLEEIFSHLKLKANISYHFLLSSEKKSECINSVIPAYNSFVDDSLKNIYDAMTNTASREKEFIIPRFGYNIPDKTELEEKIATFGSKVVFIDNGFKEENGVIKYFTRIYPHKRFDLSSWSDVK